MNQPKCFTLIYTFLERVSLFQGLENILSSNEIQIIKPHLISLIWILSPLVIIRYVLLKRNEKSFEKAKENKGNEVLAYEKYLEQRAIIKVLFRNSLVIFTIIYLLLLNK